MPDFEEVCEKSSLVVLLADSDASAQRFVADEIKRRRDDRPLWKWSEAEGLQPLAPPDGGAAGLTVGKVDLAGALERVKRAKSGVCLLALAADKVPAGERLHDALAEYLTEPLLTTVVLVSAGDRLTALLGSAASAESLTVDNRRSVAPASGVPVRRTEAAMLDPEEIKNLAMFDSPRWTEYLDRLPVRVLRQICETKDEKEGYLYEASCRRIRKLCKAMKELFVEKDDLIDLMAWASVAHLPMLLLGTFGTGKSMLVREFSRGLGIKPKQRHIVEEDDLIRKLTLLAHQQRRAAASADADAQLEQLRRVHEEVFGGHEARHFEYLVTRFTTPEELLGPVNVDALLSYAVYLRQTHSLMPRAEIVFLDEVFKSNSAILNSLLSIMNERLFYNAGTPWQVNMIMMFGASNEPPQEEDLGAFFDRFPVRALCDSVSNQSVPKLLQHAFAHEFNSLLAGSRSDEDWRILYGTGDASEKLSRAEADRFALADLAGLRGLRIEQEACVNDLRLLHKVCLYKFCGWRVGHPGSGEFMDNFLLLFRELRHAYGISDRSCSHFYRLARAKRLLEGLEHEQLLKDDCRVLRYCGRDAETLRRLHADIETYLVG